MDNNKKIIELTSRMLAEQASIEGMKADNYERKRQGLAMAWSSDIFFEVQNNLEDIAKQIMYLADNNTLWEWSYERSASEQRPMLTRTWGGYAQAITALEPHLLTCQGVCVPDSVEFYSRDFEAMMFLLDHCLTPVRRSPFALEEYRADALEQREQAADEAIAKAKRDACITGVWGYPSVADAGGKS